MVSRRTYNTDADEMLMTYPSADLGGSQAVRRRELCDAVGQMLFDNSA
jgi:hypothetical protein